MVMVMKSCLVFEPWYHKKFSVEEELMHVKHVEVKSPHVGVMWKFGRGVISSGESRDITQKRLNKLWTRLIRDPQYLKLYRNFIHECEQLGHVKEFVAENDNSEIAYYMPHHGILTPEKSTTKLRVVFNATNPTSNGLSLSSIQYNEELVQIGPVYNYD
ncbi:DUF1758 domain-containing protein [Trichonephila clavipes]|nr:DUF1758 domain-containing protein [Trichonephila clavipes]